MINLLSNGGFDGNLDRWTGTGSIDRSLGYPRAGCLALAAGESMESDAVGLSEDSLYTLHYFYRLASGATLTASVGGVSVAHIGAPADAWREASLAFALDAGATDGVTFSATSDAAYVDSVALFYGALPIDRTTLTSMISAQLRSLASDAGLLTIASAAGPNGDYSAAIDEGLRAVGAVNGWGDADITALVPAQINAAVEAAKGSMIQALRADYALQTDVRLGPRQESRSQVAASLDAMLAGGGASNRPTVGRLRHEEWPG